MPIPKPKQLAEWLHTYVVEGKVLVAVSGGLDSMCLWELLQASGCAYAAVHVNYHLRGHDSNLDQALIEQVAAERKCKLHVIDNHQLSGQQGIQAKARDIRYGAFEQLMDTHNYSATLLAHHADDQLEQVFIGLARGSGPASFAGMQAQRDRYLRPLLNTSRQELSAFAKTAQITYREDASNASDDYLRNRMRHHVLPAFVAIDASARRNLLSTLSHQRALLSFAAQQSEALAHSCRSEIFVDALDTHALREIQGLGYFIHERLRPYGFSSANCYDIVARISSGVLAKAVYENNLRTHQVVCSGQTLWLEPTRRFAPFMTAVSVSGSVTCDLGELEVIGLPRGCNLIWRTANELDLVPNRTNKKQLSTILKQRKLRNIASGSVTVLTYLDKVIWVPGLNELDVEIPLAGHEIVSLSYLPLPEAKWRISL